MSLKFVIIQIVEKLKKKRRNLCILKLIVSKSAKLNTSTKKFYNL